MQRLIEAKVTRYSPLRQLAYDPSMNNIRLFCGASDLIYCFQTAHLRRNTKVKLSLIFECQSNRVTLWLGRCIIARRIELLCLPDHTETAENHAEFGNMICPSPAGMDEVICPYLASASEIPW